MTEGTSTARSGHEARWKVEGFLAAVAFVSALATVSNGPRGSIWVKVLCGLAVVGVLVLVTPSLYRRWQTWRRERRRAALLRESWSKFAVEVTERSRFFNQSDVRSLYALLIALRAVPEDEAGVRRFHSLRQAAQGVIALNGVMLSLGMMAAQTWPGEAQASLIVSGFERLFDYPDTSGLVRELHNQALEVLDAKLIEEWTRFYQASRSEYGKFARDENSAIGEKVFGEYFKS